MRFQTLLRLPKTSEELVRDMVFFTNGFRLPREIVFGPPKHFTPLEGDANGNDTAVRVSLPRDCQRRDMGFKWLYYKRLDLDSLVASNEDGISLEPGVYTLGSILPKINALYRINLQAADILDATYTAGDATPAVLQASPNSLAWQGEITLPIAAPLQLVSNTELNGFMAETV